MGGAMRARKRVKMKTDEAQQLSSGSRGVGRRGKVAFHLEVRTGSHGCKKIHMAHFGVDRELAKMVHDLAKLTCMGKEKYLALKKGKLNFSERRSAVVEFLKENARLVTLADAHRQKDAVRQPWDSAMKETLRELASDVLRQLRDTAQEAAGAQAIESQNINVGYGDKGLPFDIDAALEDGADPTNWPYKKDALRSISPELPELSSEDFLDMFCNESAPLEEKKMFEEGHGLQSSGDY